MHFSFFSFSAACDIIKMSSPGMRTYGKGYDMKSCQLYENKPAQAFRDAHLLGNGALGASVFGSCPTERILLNCDTLWSGYEKPHSNPAFYDNLQKAQKLILDGKLRQANDIVDDTMQGEWCETYLPLGDLYITIGQPDNERNRRLWENWQTGAYPAQEYSRRLDLCSAVSRVEYRRFGIRYTEESFVSAPAGLLAVKITAEDGALAFALSMDSVLRHTFRAQGNTYCLTGRAPDHAEPPYEPVKPALVYYDDEKSRAVRFAACAEIAETDGKISCDGMRLYVSGATYAVVLVAADTDYRGFRVPRSGDAGLVAGECRVRISAAKEKGYDSLKDEHIADYRSFFDRTSLDLGEDITGALPTTERFNRAKNNIDDPGLDELLFAAGKYMLISSSRPGTQATCLQGIWNDSLTPICSSNYTTNINIQMNYWGAEVLGLPECHEPMLNFTGECAVTGQETARGYYRLPGWVVHHNSDLWRYSVPACEDASFAFWPMGGFWMLRHLWEHYLYTLDKAFLRRVLPTIRGAAEFLVHFLVFDPARGYWVTLPSTSPENRFILPGHGSFSDFTEQMNGSNRWTPDNPDLAAVSESCTMDIAITREVFGIFRDACGILGEDDPLIAETAEKEKGLPPYRVSPRSGTLQEWIEDYDECMPGITHVSHLYPVFPGEEITKEKAPVLFEAAYRSLLRRRRHAGMRGGWGTSWAIALAARFGDPEIANQSIASSYSYYSASTLTHSEQIDGISGYIAGVCELLMQSHGGKIRLFCALPHSWRRGSVSGLCARGGFTVDMAWNDGKPASASVTSRLGGLCRMEAPGLSSVTVRGERIAACGGAVSLDTKPGDVLTLVF